MRLLSQTNLLLPSRYDLRLILLSLQHPKYLLLQTIYFENNKNVKLESPSSSASSRVVRLHANAKNLDIKKIFGGTLIEKSPEDNSKVTPEMHDVMTVKIDESNTSKKIHLLVDAKLNLDEMKGMYRSRYRPTPNSEEKIMWSTHFEPIASRDAFVCVDEPISRPDYNFSYLWPNNEETKNLTGLANQPLIKTLDKVSVNSFFVSEEESFGDSTDQTKQELSDAITEWLHEEKKQIVSASSIEASNFKQLIFDTQPKISPYLNAIAIGELTAIDAEKYVSKLSGREIPIRLNIPTGYDVNLAKFPLQCLRHALEFFENYFEVPFPFKKLDAFTPPDFAIGGEESILIALTCRVLLDEEKTAVARRIVLNDLLAHEVSHLWFGDLVSIADWRGLWLKEGFASFFGCFAVEDRRPEWNAFAQITKGMYGAMETDSHVATHAVEVEIEDNSKITQIFDGLCYDKGMAGVFQLFKFLGPEGFRKAISNYLKKYQWQGTTTPELWQSLEDTSGKPISKIMNSFTSLPGYPVVTASLSEDKKSLKLSQSRFSFSAPASAVDAASKSPLWTIPVVVQVLNTNNMNDAGDHKFSSFNVDMSEKEITVALDDASSVIMVNEDHNGFFRTEYDDVLFEKILASYEKLSVPFRNGLIDDAVALVASGRSCRQLLQLLDKVHQYETSAVVLSHAAGRVPSLVKKYTSGSTSSSSTLMVLFEKCLGVFVDRAEKLGQKTIESETSDDSQLRSVCWHVVFKAFDLIKSDVRLQQQVNSNDLLKKVVQLAESFLKNSITIANDIISASDINSVSFDSNLIVIQLRFAVRFAASHQEEEDSRNKIYDGLWQTYCKDPDAIICREIVLALTSTPCAARFEKLAKETYDPDETEDGNEKIRSQQGHIMTANLVANPSLGTEVNLWKVFTKSIASVIRRWGGGQFRIQMICEWMGAVMNSSEEGAEKFRKFFEENPIPNADLAIKRAHQQIQVRAEIKERVSKEIESLLLKKM